MPTNEITGDTQLTGFAVLLEVDGLYDAHRALALRGRTRVLLGEGRDGIAELVAEVELFAAARCTRGRGRARPLELLGAAHEEAGDRDQARRCSPRSTGLCTQIRPAGAERIRLQADAL
ncbi:hypothetical protein [Streptomyces sp. MZ04]|uniref:hypothetical protein n=1 Tax=Streptomyces sp. MZ04 TaxID=2559236 RepID=UPI00107EB8FE|nr:hypothetical protein [Streptomyces sp. MZ04]TGB15540.1 hypothetical protein E2651_02680 [Streptomyces sp. MZ04]